MAKIWTFILLILLSASAHAGVVYLHNSTHRTLLLTYQLCVNNTHCGNPNRLTLAPNTEIALNISPNNYFSVLMAISDGPHIDAWKGNWSAGFKVGQCTAQPATLTSLMGNKITFSNFGGSPDLLCIVSRT